MCSTSVFFLLESVSLGMCVKMCFPSCLKFYAFLLVAMDIARTANSCVNFTTSTEKLYVEQYSMATVNFTIQQNCYPRHIHLHTITVEHKSNDPGQNVFKPTCQLIINEEGKCSPSGGCECLSKDQISITRNMTDRHGEVWYIKGKSNQKDDVRPELTIHVFAFTDKETATTQLSIEDSTQSGELTSAVNSDTESYYQSFVFWGAIGGLSLLVILLFIVVCVLVIKRKGGSSSSDRNVRPIVFRRENSRQSEPSLQRNTATEEGIYNVIHDSGSLSSTLSRATNDRLSLQSDENMPFTFTPTWRNTKPSGLTKTTRVANAASTSTASTTSSIMGLGSIKEDDLHSFADRKKKVDAKTRPAAKPPDLPAPRRSTDLPAAICSPDLPAPRRSPRITPRNQSPSPCLASTSFSSFKCLPSTQEEDEVFLDNKTLLATGFDLKTPEPNTRLDRGETKPSQTNPYPARNIAELSRAASREELATAAARKTPKPAPYVPVKINKSSPNLRSREQPDESDYTSMEGDTVDDYVQPDPDPDAVTSTRQESDDSYLTSPKYRQDSQQTAVAGADKTKPVSAEAGASNLLRPVYKPEEVKPGAKPKKIGPAPLSRKPMLHSPSSASDHTPSKNTDSSDRCERSDSDRIPVREGSRVKLCVRTAKPPAPTPVAPRDMLASVFKAAQGASLSTKRLFRKPTAAMLPVDSQGYLLPLDKPNPRVDSGDYTLPDSYC